MCAIYTDKERECVTSVANLATLSLDLATFQTPLATFKKKKHLATNLATFGKTLSKCRQYCPASTRS